MKCAVCDKKINKTDKIEAVTYRIRISARRIFVHNTCDWLQNDTRIIKETT